MTTGVVEDDFGVSLVISSCGVAFLIAFSELIIALPGGEKANLIFSFLLLPGVDRTLSISDKSTPSISDGSPKVNSES